MPSSATFDDVLAANAAYAHDFRLLEELEVLVYSPSCWAREFGSRTCDNPVTFRAETNCLGLS